MSLSRRRLLAGSALGLVSPVLLTPATGFAATRWSAPRSVNGWPVAAPGDLVTGRLEGSAAEVTLRTGAPDVVLRHVLRRFHYEVAPLGRGDVVGHVASPTVRTAAESNHLSATAVAVLPGVFPVGVRGGLTGSQLVVLRDILAECGGTVRWGGDAVRPAEGAFWLDGPPSDRFDRVAAAIAGWRGGPGLGGAGAGTPVDLLDPLRRKAATSLARVQLASSS